MEQYLLKTIKNIRPYTLTLEFNTGGMSDVNLEPKLCGQANEANSIYKKLLDPKYFITAKYEKDQESIYWDNGIDLCADVLYQIAQETQQPKKESEIIKAIFLLFKTLYPSQKKNLMTQLKQELAS